MHIPVEDIAEVLLGVTVEHIYVDLNPAEDGDMSELFLDTHQEIRLVGTGTNHFFDRFIWRILLVHLHDGAEFPDIHWDEPYYLIPIPIKYTVHSITFGKNGEPDEDEPDHFVRIIVSNNGLDPIIIKVPLEEHTTTLDDVSLTLQ